MSGRLAETSRFKRDLRRMMKRGKDADKLRRIVDALLAGETPAARHRPHRLSGAYAGYWECHIDPDWLLIWEQDGGVTVLVRTGSHSDLFG